MRINAGLCKHYKILPARLKPLVLGDNTLMREQGQNIDAAKTKVKSVLGVTSLIKIRSARGKSEETSGKVTALFPAVFTVEFDDGTSRTFPYADVTTGHVLFLSPKEKTP